MGGRGGRWRQGLLYMRNKIFFFRIYINTFIREDMKEDIAFKEFLQQEGQQQAESCSPEDYLQHKVLRPLDKYLEMGNLPLDFRKNSSKEEKAVAQTRIIMEFVGGNKVDSLKNLSQLTKKHFY